MSNMKRCVAQVSLSGSWGVEHLQPGMAIDFARVLTPARDAAPAKGDVGTDGYVPPIAAQSAFTVADAVAGREDWFEEIGEPAATDFSDVTISAIAPLNQE